MEEIINLCGIVCFLFCSYILSVQDINNVVFCICIFLAGIVVGVDKKNI